MEVDEKFEINETERCNKRKCSSSNNFYSVCKSGDYKRAELMVRDIKNHPNLGLWAACEGGHLDIVNLMIAHGACEWSRALERACCSGNLEIVQLLLSKIGKSNHRLILASFRDTIDNGLQNACEHGHLEIVQCLIQKHRGTLYEGMTIAYYAGHFQIVEYLCKHVRSCHGVLRAACFRGDLKTVQRLLQFNISSKDDLELGLDMACQGGHLNIVELMIENGATDIEYGFVLACDAGHLHVARFLIEKGIGDLNRAMSKTRHPDIFDLLITHGATEFDKLDRTMTAEMLNRGHVHIQNQHTDALVAERVQRQNETENALTEIMTFSGSLFDLELFSLILPYVAFE